MNVYLLSRDAKQRALTRSASETLRVAAKPAFTLIELLVVMAIIAVLIGLLLPAIQRVRESANRVSCGNNLKQVALGTHLYEHERGKYPPGLAHPGADGRITSLFVEILPYIEQGHIYQNWDFANNGANFGGTGTAGGATAIRTYTCPSAGAKQNPAVYGTQAIGLSTYAGNGGSRSYPLADATVDGFFHTVGPDSKPAAGQQQVKAMMVTDGLSTTLMYGERNIHDTAMDSYQQAPFITPPDPPLQAMTAYCGWGAPMGPTAISANVLSSAVGINFSFPEAYTPPTSGPVIPLNWNAYKDAWALRLNAFGSRHPLLMVAAMGDGSIRTIHVTVSPTAFRAMTTRAGGESVTE